MKLYKILQLHGAPKDSEILTYEFIVKNNDEEVFNYISVVIGWDAWDEKEFESGQYETFEELKRDVMKEKGDLESDEGWEDAYCGVTKYGWEDMGEISDEEIKVLKKLKLL